MPNKNMPDCRWILPVKRWSAWPAPGVNEALADAAQALAAKPDVSYVEPMLRRRISSLGKMGLKVAHDCVMSSGDVRLVFASRHGELRRTTEILQALVRGQPISPTAFSLSVLNAMAGVFGIARRDRSPAIAISAGAETLGYGLLEAYAQYTSNPSEPVLFVYAHEPRDPVFGPSDEFDDEPLAVAILLASDAVQMLECGTATISASSEPSPISVPQSASQVKALLHCLASGAAADWAGGHAVWQWRQRAGAV